MRVLGLIGTVGICGAIAAAGGCATSAVFQQELTKTNTQTVMAFEETVFNKHEVPEAFAHYVGADFIEHDPRLSGRAAEVRTSGAAADAGATGDVNDRAAALRAYGELVRQLAAASHREFVRTIAQGDLVATQSDWEQLPGRAHPIPVVDIYRLNQGRIVEHWDVMQAPAALVPQARAGAGDGPE